MKKNKSGRWTDIQRKFVKDNVDILTIEEMSEILNKSVNSIKFRCYKVGLKYKSKNDWIKCFIFLSFYDTTLHEGDFCYWFCLFFIFNFLLECILFAILCWNSYLGTIGYC